MQYVTLNNGVEMPQLGFGVWQVPDDEAYSAVTEALGAGYRSIDTARAYENEEGTGRAVRDSGIARDELFVTTKLWNTDHAYDDAVRAVDASLERLGLDHVDLILIHWPVAGSEQYLEAWKAFEKAYADGKARAIGVSNFTVEALERLTKEAEVTPVINQIELHPYMQQKQLRAAGAEHGLLTEAWSPLGQGKGLLDDAVLKRIGAKHGKSAAQAVLRWHLQTGNVVIPKSVTPSRIKENIDVFDFELDAADLAEIEALDQGKRFGPDPATFNWMG
ncbi:aldo/keto reductase [Actinomadura barringtoniae]|nr:aldo/keto reductase [Actinomadura barringtoniae]